MGLVYFLLRAADIFKTEFNGPTISSGKKASNFCGRFKLQQPRSIHHAFCCVLHITESDTDSLGTREAHSSDSHVQQPDVLVLLCRDGWCLLTQTKNKKTHVHKHNEAPGG